MIRHVAGKRVFSTNTITYIIISSRDPDGTVGACYHYKYLYEEGSMRKERMKPVDMEGLWGNGIDVPLTDRLDEFFEKNDVGFDAVSSWNDEEILSTSYYDLLKWYALDDPFASLSSGIMKSLSPRMPVFSRERVDFINSIYWSWGGDFRYDLPV